MVPHFFVIHELSAHCISNRPSPAQGKHVSLAERDPRGHASQPGTLIGSGPLQDTEASPEIEMNVTLLRRALKNPQPSVTFVSDHKIEYWQVSDPCGLDTKEQRGPCEAFC